MRLVILESPFAGEVATNITYLRACLRDCLLRGEAPFASHGLYTQPGVLKDEKPTERELGMKAGFAWHRVAEATVVYVDRGISSGMKSGITRAIKDERPIIFRSLDPKADPVKVQIHSEHEFGIARQT